MGLNWVLRVPPNISFDTAAKETDSSFSLTPTCPTPHDGSNASAARDQRSRHTACRGGVGLCLGPPGLSRSHPILFVCLFVFVYLCWLGGFVEAAPQPPMTRDLPFRPCISIGVFDYDIHHQHRTVNGSTLSGFAPQVRSKPCRALLCTRLHGPRRSAARRAARLSVSGCARMGQHHPQTTLCLVALLCIFEMLRSLLLRRRPQLLGVTVLSNAS